MTHTQPIQVSAFHQAAAAESLRKVMTSQWEKTEAKGVVTLWFAGTNPNYR
jgi:hypothetical protein